MKTQYVADEHTIINVQGIRFVEKAETSFGGPSPVHLELRVTYKGDVLRYRYPDAATRDAQFDRLRVAMACQPPATA